MKTYMTPEEHARLHRRRARQTLGLLIAVLALVGIVTVVRAGVKGVATLFDDTQQKAEYEDRLEGLVLFDPLPFDGIENIDDLTLREAAVWGCVYSIQETQGSFDNYNTDPDTEQLLLPSVDVDAYPRHRQRGHLPRYRHQTVQEGRPAPRYRGLYPHPEQ